MAIEDFMHRANIPTDDIKSAFENIMAVYCLYIGIGQENKFKISYGNSETSLNILMDSKERALDLLKTYNGTCLRIYGQVYLVCGEVQDNIVRFELLSN